MSVLSKLFGKGEEPLPTFEDPQLGPMAWSKNDEAWTGRHDGFHYALAYERKSAPSQELLAYAKEVLGDRAWLIGTLEAEKKKAALEASPSAKSEIEALSFGVISFYRHKDIRRIIADIEGGEGYRSWRIEYRERVCEGLGFDT